MSQQHADAVQVQRQDHDPAAFRWRGRIYLVQGVRAHWVETGPWWRSASVRALLARPPDQGGSDPGRPRGSGGREFWQVDARPRRGTARGVYELCFDWTSTPDDGWSVTTADRDG